MRQHILDNVSQRLIGDGLRVTERFRIEGDTLFVESAPAPSITFPGKTDYRRIVWQREK